MRILVVCGAGASSAFVAHRIRHTGEARGLELTVHAGSESDLPGSLDPIDVLLVGPYLAPRYEKIRAEAIKRGVGVALLPDTVFASQNGDEALDLAIYAFKSRGWAELRA
ncbi:MULTISPECIES: PTS sugar transporter subunit IIB [Cryobacterium]|nr:MULTISPECIES: PTS sugar transporter [Cryobacterium]MDY7529092.1 PTS sugar transporter [Cryobacterium sp. 10C2]MDY7558742.1 PTS sugar transporter [Cryobacterium sp. 10C3]MEB0002223.1 PTS sugar transporter [Cryobacterium sp. RTC2.1]MEB0202763.1 PTS sugar transporter [Cryobacterium sp. 5I3]MEB0287271.1 PTS sugar transporter [Cryobacterium sp. 10S3]